MNETFELLDRIEAAAAQATRGPWQVHTEDHPHHFGGKHQERRIFTTWHHPQLQGPLGVVNGSVGIGPTEGAAARHMVAIGQADAEFIAMMDPQTVLRLCKLARSSAELQPYVESGVARTEERKT